MTSRTTKTNPKQRSTRKSQPAVRKTKSRTERAVDREETEEEEGPPSSRRMSPTTPVRRLDAILRALPDKELRALIDRMGIRVDAKKRIDEPAQVARALLRLPDLREPS
ncbi:MAG: hypothetical protein KC731_17400, partial [Myxococcales bacterium]|nr:hypothetical protein [Myxococcales bacterium]